MPRLRAVGLGSGARLISPSLQPVAAGTSWPMARDIHTGIQHLAGWGAPLSKVGFAGGMLGAPGGTGCLHGPEGCCWKGHPRGAVQGAKGAHHRAVLSGSHPLPLFVEGLGTLKSYQPGHFACAAALPVRGPCVQQGKPSCVAAGACSRGHLMAAAHRDACVGHTHTHKLGTGASWGSNKPAETLFAVFQGIKSLLKFSSY